MVSQYPPGTKTALNRMLLHIRKSFREHLNHRDNQQSQPSNNSTTPQPEACSHLQCLDMSENYPIMLDFHDRTLQPLRIAAQNLRP
ncbi:hypothetical protein CRG98_041626 [Punica granatum]|uniref:Uncharacterized protein n=1 Tax=Punica granatum TaxID=22663 RepID=A0A2I0I1W5_PUNGR|nr:hypothetical protein CRG98_041626 [Punica granatum]